MAAEINPAKAHVSDTVGILMGPSMVVLSFGSALTSWLASPFSDDARKVAEQQLPASNEKDTITYDLEVGTVAYAVTAVTGIIPYSSALIAMSSTKKTHPGWIVFAVSGILTLIASAIGMSFNGRAYYLASSLQSDSQFNSMLGLRITSLGLNAIAFGTFLTQMILRCKNAATPNSAA